MQRMIDDSVLTDIADAIREKNGTTETYQDVEMAQAVRDISAKEEQEKTIDITENGTTEILPDEGKVLSKVTVEVDVKGEEFIGVKYSDFDSSDGYNLPTVADARSMEQVLTDKHSKRFVMNDRFYNIGWSIGAGYFTKLQTIYLPKGITSLISTFFNCVNLKHIIGDLSEVEEVNDAFYDCMALSEMPYMPNLIKLSGRAFGYCEKFKSITFYKVLTNWSVSAFQGCTNITDFTIPQGWNTNIYLHYCPNLTQECLHRAIENYADMTGQTSPVCQIGSVNIEKIDDEHKAMATAKNITLA